MSQPLLILATRSKARRAMMRELGMKFTTAAADIDETPRRGELPVRYVKRLALSKSFAINRKDGIIITVDTIVECKGRLLGQPKDAADARRMLRMMSGSPHNVISAIVVRNAHTGKIISNITKTKVTFTKISRQMIDWYISTGEPFRRAGSYAIQGAGRAFIKRVDGCLSNVIGMSLPELLTMLRKIGARAL